MKKTILTFTLLLTVLMANSSESKNSFGWGISSTLHSINPGISMRYTNTDKVGDQIAFQFSWLFNDTDRKQAAGKDIEYIFSFNFQPRIKLTKGTSLYPIYGMNYTTYLQEYENNYSENISNMGINLGLGSRFKIQPYLYAHAEWQYSYGDITYSLYTAGLQFNL